jgi:uncharacterized protein YkwD
LRPIRTAKAAVAAAQFESLGNPLSRHRAITRVTVAAFSFTLLIALSSQAPAQAGPGPSPVSSEPLLPQSVGIAVETDAGITIPFDAAMAPESVEAALQVLPAQKIEVSWNSTRTRATISPERRWRTDERYLVVVSAASTTEDGAPLAGARRFTFTTETAPAVTDFQVHLAGAEPAAQTAPETAISTRSTSLEADPNAAAALEAEALPIGGGATVQSPSTTATAVSASSSIAVAFSEVMDRADVESRFSILPEVGGDLSWSGTNLVFTPTGRLDAGGRYTISVAGAHDMQGNVLGGQDAFSFIVQAGAQLTKTTPDRGASGVDAAIVEMWFSRPMNETATNKAFALVDSATGSAVGGHLTWNDASTRLTFTPDGPFAGGRTYAITLARGARDADGNGVRTEWSFTTKAAPIAVARSTTSTRSAPSIPPPGPATSLAGYALNQVNAARAAYGFAPLVLDAGVSAVASAHAWDQARNGYFSHYGLDGSTRETRLARGGVSFGWSGENQCYHIGMSQQATLNWCHAQFMSEPYPGYWNHIGNILNPNARRMGVGIATVGGKTVITWDFTD